jgi:hypothetical protein
MYSIQSLGKFKEMCPKLNDILSMTWWCFVLEVFLERAFVSKLKENIIAASMYVAAIKPYHALWVLYSVEATDFLVVMVFCIFCEVSFKNKDIGIGVVHLLTRLVNITCRLDIRAIWILQSEIRQGAI